MSSILDFRDRTSLFRTASDRTFDVLVIGGGITGAGIARDAAMRGLDVILVEARDFASGTSSRSSKMVHGGLRYLAQGDMGLVKEAASERKILRSIAPHLARPMPFVIPARSRAAIATLKSAVWTFEKLGGVPKEERHEVWMKSAIPEHEPALRCDSLSGAVVYLECLTDDARLTLANIRSAKKSGAHILSYAPVTEITQRDGKATGAIVKSSLPGEDLQTEIKAQFVVNAAGPWVDAVRHLEDQHSAERLQLTRGIHVVLPRDKLPISRTVIMTASDKRSVFAVPRGDFTYLGTTDTFYPSTDYWPTIDVTDIDYVLDAANRTFNTDAVTQKDIQSIWSGIRPLIAQPGKSPSEISRRDEVWEGPLGVLSIAGGKLTAYRRMALRVVDQLQEKMRHKVTPSTTDKEPLPGGEQSIDAVLNHPNLGKLGESARERLAWLYGDEAPQIAAHGADIRAEVRQAVTFEGALTLEDYWSRRSARAWFDTAGGLVALKPAADEMAALLDWNDERKKSEIETCRQQHERSLSALAV